MRRVGLRLVDQGNMVHANDANGLAVITEVQRIAVVFSLPEDNLPQIVRARSRTDGPPLVVEAFNRDLKTRLGTGELAALDNQIDPGTGTIRMKAIFDNAEGVLYPNQFVNVRMLVNTRKNVVLVPAAAVQRSPQTPFVYVVKEDDSVDLQPVKVGPSEGDETVIEEGLEAGVTVVTDGVDKLEPGKKVVVRTAEAPATRAAKGGAGPATRAATGAGGGGGNR